MPTLNCILLQDISLQPNFVPVYICSSQTFNHLRVRMFPSADIAKLSQIKLFELQPHISITDDKYMESFSQAIKSARSLSPILDISSICPKQPPLFAV